MIIYVQGDLLDSNAEALVNPVNTVGTMGKGLAMQFRNRYPKNFELYKRACFSSTLKIGNLLIVEELGKKIINFPTKEHWNKPSRYSFVRMGLDTLKEEIVNRQIRSIAIPPLGCGLGGLYWPRVKKAIEKKLSDLYYTDIYIYEPPKHY